MKELILMIPEKVAKAMEETRARDGSEDDLEVIRRALSVYHGLVEETSKGAKVKLEYEDGSLLPFSIKVTG